MVSDNVSRSQGSGACARTNGAYAYRRGSSLRALGDNVSKRREAYGSHLNICVTCFSVHVLGLMHDFTEEKRFQLEAELARIDDLTLVKNRRGFKENAELLFKLAARQIQPITLVYLDVDDLKTVNDSLGHPEGDRVLRAVGNALLGSVRAVDLVGRLGGDEFALVLPRMKASDAKAAIERLHQRIVKMMRDNGWVTGASMGIISFSDSIPDLEDALSCADTLMYEAKKTGKNKLIFKEFA